MKIAIIIPILNEAATITELLSHLVTASKNDTIAEIIVVDGGSTDTSASRVHAFAATQAIPIRFVPSKKGRAIQMNTGAKVATAPILYFLHADSYPPTNYDQAIIQHVAKGHRAGCFRMKFDSTHWWLQFVGWLTKFESKRCRGGDQSLFIERSLFYDIGGYDESYIVYEDNELIDRLFAIHEFVVIPDYIITSARRYEETGVWRLQYHFLNIHIRKWLGASSTELYRYYKEHVSASNNDTVHP